jgi:N4-gp56 family major capsid protein
MAEISYTELQATSQALVASIVQEVLKQKAVLLPTVTDYSSFAVKGSKSVGIPRRSQFAAASKAENSALTAQELTFAVDTIDLNLHKAVYASIERAPGYQANVNAQSEVVNEMALELALQSDKDIITCLKGTSAAAPDHRVQFANTPTNTIQQTDILEARRLLNVAKVPMADRFLVVPPDQEKAMLLIGDFVRADSYGNANGLMNGELGRLYGFTVLMHTELVAAEFLAYHKSHVGYASQIQPEFDTNKDLKNVADEYLLHHLYGCKTMSSGVRGVWFNATGA